MRLFTAEVRLQCILHTVGTISNLDVTCSARTCVDLSKLDPHLFLKWCPPQ